MTYELTRPAIEMLTTPMNDAHEIQPFNVLARLPIALATSACRQSVDILNQLLADTVALRDFCRNNSLANCIQETVDSSKKRGRRSQTMTLHDFLRQFRSFT